MAITTYAELQTAIALWLRPGSGSTTGLQLTDFITLFESRANRRLRLRVMESDESVVAVVGSRAIALPTGFIDPIGFWLTDLDPREELIYSLPESLHVTTVETRPQYWAIDGTNIVFECESDAAYTAIFRMLKSFALSGSVTTNWLLTNHPDLYLYGSLLEAAPFVRDKDMISVWKAFVEEAFSDIENKEQRARGLAALRTDLSLTSTSNILRG